MIKTEVFGRTKEGEEVLVFTLQSGASYCKILSLGGIVQSLVVPDKNGVLTDVILGYNTVAEYERNDGYLGALIGRFGNRIDKGVLTIDGKTYALYCNDKGNHLHGGKVGFDAKIWEHEICGEELILSLFSPDGEENYPGNLTVRVSYTFTNNTLSIGYHAISDKKTAINMTNHAYFHLDGEGKGDCREHLLRMDSDRITPTDEGLIPRGEFKGVENTPFDFRTEKKIGRDIDDFSDTDMKNAGGYDHCYVLRHRSGQFAEYARVRSEKSGICMTCATDMPAVHLYTGNWLKAEGKSGFYGKQFGFCLETEAIPNNVNVAEYAKVGSSIYDAGQPYHFTASYAFTIEN